MIGGNRDTRNVIRHKYYHNTRVERHSANTLRDRYHNVLLILTGRHMTIYLMQFDFVEYTI